MRYPNREPVRIMTDPNGTRVAHVAVAKGGPGCPDFAAIELEEFQRLAPIYGTYYYWNRNSSGQAYVSICRRAPFGGERRAPCAVARLVAGADDTHCVRYTDGDRSNLRRSNLRLCRKSALSRAHAPRGAAT